MDAAIVEHYNITFLRFFKNFLNGSNKKQEYTLFICKRSRTIHYLEKVW